MGRAVMRSGARFGWAALTGAVPPSVLAGLAGFALAGDAPAVTPALTLVAGAVDVPDDEADGVRAELEELNRLEATVHPAVLEAYGLRAAHAHAPAAPARAPL